MVTFYVKNWYPNTPKQDRDPAKVKWELYEKKESEIIKLKTFKEGKLQFSEKEIGKQFLVVGYLYEAELNNASAMKITVVPTEKTQILSVEVLDINGQKIKVNVCTTGLQGAKLNIELWEHDANKEGHNDKNTKVTVASQFVPVGKNGIATTEMLIPLNFKKYAEAQGDKGKESAKHEYYVTAYHDGTQRVASGNIDFTNTKTPEQRKQETRDHLDQKPKRQEPTPGHKGKVPKTPPTPPKSTPAPASPPNNTPHTPAQPQPVAKKGISNVYITDANDKAITSTVTGGIIKAHIISTGLIGKEIRFKLYEEDVTENQEVVNQKFKIDKDHYIINVTLKNVSRSKGDDFFEGSEQEFFVDIEVLDTQAHIKSAVIDVDVKALKQDVPTNVTKTKVEQQEVKTKENKFGICEHEAKVRAFLRMLRVGEGTEGESGYKKLFGGDDFTASPHNKSMKTHPKITITKGGYSSTASGAYQILGDTYDNLISNYKNDYNIVGFDQESQDKLCLTILKHNYRSERSKSFFEPRKKDKTIDKEKQKERAKFKGKKGDIIQLILNDNFDDALLISSLCWASLPDAPYGQPSETRETAKTKYDEFFKEEKENKSKDLHLKKGFLREFGYANCIPFAAADGIVTYRIYKDGIIEKHIPKTIKKGFENKYKYIYIGTKNVEHEICTVDWEEIDKVQFSTTLKSIPKDYISSEDFNISGVNQKHVYKYKDGSVVASGDAGEGGGTIINKYIKFKGQVILIKMPDSINYDSKGVRINLTFENTIRKYMGADQFAALIGALAECGFDKVISEGSAMKDGTCFPSVSHVNGESIDTDYFKDSKGILKQKEQQDFIDALAKFGFKDFYYSPNMNFTKPSKVNKFSKQSHHKAHLHAGAKNINILTIKE